MFPKKLLAPRAVLHFSARPTFHFGAAKSRILFARGFCSGPNLINLVKQLRKDTNAGISDCKDALVASEYDIEKAKTWLVEKAKITAAKKSGRLAQEGGVLALASGSKGLLIELNCETDFAAREPQFVSTIRGLSGTLANFHDTLLKDNSIPATLGLTHKAEVAGFNVSTVGEAVQQLTFLFKENVLLRRVLAFPPAGTEAKSRSIHSYVHSPIDGSQPQVGKIGCLVSLATSAEPNAAQADTIKKLGNIICVQVAGGKPIILEGDKTAPRLSTVDNCDFINDSDFEPRLLEQDSVISDGTIRELIQQCEKETGLTIKIEDFARWELNAGEEKEQGDLAADIQAILKQE